MKSGPGHRVDIQALRALAVTLVLIFHLSPGMLPGGYIGVDVFFVLSGFLITAHLVREVLQTGSIRLGRFWARRVRRLIPAALLVLIVSVVAVWLFLPSSVREQNFIEIAFASVYLLNWRLAADSVDYLAADNAHSIAQHYWSLSVEEQFYLVWPVLILVAIWLLARKGQSLQSSSGALGTERLEAVRKRAVLLLLVVVFVISLGYSIYETGRSQPSAYFITTTRAWEFALGGIVALLPSITLKKWAFALVSWGAIALVVTPAFLFTGVSSFPGWIALIPVIGTSVLLWVGDESAPQSWTPQFLGKNRAVQFIGDVSYAAYLWHWPLIVAVTAVLGRAPGYLWAGAILAVTVVLATATKFWVEDPVRKAGGALRRGPVTYGLMLAGIAIVLVVTLPAVGTLRAQAAQSLSEVAAASEDETGCFGAYAVINGCDDPYALTASVDPDASKIDTPPKYLESFSGCEVQNVNDRVQYRCEVRSAEATRGVMLLGDSHAYALFPGFAAASEAQGWQFSMRAKPLCSAFPGVASNQSGDDEASCTDWSNAVRDELLQSDLIDVVVFASVENEYFDGSDQVIKFFDEIRASGKEVVLLQRVPGAGPGVLAPDCVASSLELRSPCSFESTQTGTWITEVARTANVPTLNPWDLLCHDGTCEVVIGGTVVYMDNHHLTATFARTLAPWIGAELEYILSKSE